MISDVTGVCMISDVTGVCTISYVNIYIHNHMVSMVDSYNWSSLPLCISTNSPLDPTLFWGPKLN